MCDKQTFRCSGRVTFFCQGQKVVIVDKHFNTLISTGNHWQQFLRILSVDAFLSLSYYTTLRVRLTIAEILE